MPYLELRYLDEDLQERPLDSRSISEQHFQIEMKIEGNVTVPFTNCTSDHFQGAPEVYDMKTRNGTLRNLICVDNWQSLSIPNEAQSLYPDVAKRNKNLSTAI